jgi:pentatricopeptide repeat protein
MFHMMIYMYKKAGDYTQARKLFAQMPERGIPQSAVTFNSLMSFEADYKEVSSIYDQVLLQRNSTISIWSAATDWKI